jgi:hypothetical protein
VADVGGYDFSRQPEQFWTFGHWFLQDLPDGNVALAP